MLMNLTEVLSHDNKVIEAQAEIEMDAVRIRKDMFPIVQKIPVTLKITNIGKKKLSIEGSTKLAVQIPCDRCLEDTRIDLNLAFQREIDLSLSEAEAEAVKDEYGIEGARLDTEQFIYNEIIMNWPMKVLCEDNCQGICRRCGTNLNKGDCSCDTAALDPRMAAIRDIFKNNKEV